MNQYEHFDIWLSQQNRPKGRDLCIKRNIILLKNSPKLGAKNGRIHVATNICKC